MSKNVVLNKDKDNNSLTPKDGHQTSAYVPQYRVLLKEGLVAGLGWAFGVTIGFVLVSSLLVITFKTLGGVPVVGVFIADVVESTQEQLLKRSIIMPGSSL